MLCFVCGDNKRKVSSTKMATMPPFIKINYNNFGHNFVHSDPDLVCSRPPAFFSTLAVFSQVPPGSQQSTDYLAEPKLPERYTRLVYSPMICMSSRPSFVPSAFTGNRYHADRFRLSDSPSSSRPSQTGFFLSDMTRPLVDQFHETSITTWVILFVAMVATVSFRNIFASCLSVRCRYALLVILSIRWYYLFGSVSFEWLFVASATITECNRCQRSAVERWVCESERKERQMGA
uniref:Uncharacterized protein n=1 Tax=Anopheles culicifacies TaxID=139723 RepID=A0A182MBW4_9DIPT